MQRNHCIKVRLSDEEYLDLMDKVNESKLSRERFIINCIKKTKFQTAPNIGYYKLIEEFNHIGNNLNQLTKRVNINQIDELGISSCISELRTMISNVDKAVRG